MSRCVRVQKVVLLAVVIAVVFCAAVACDDDSVMVEVGGMKIYEPEGVQVFRKFPATWKVGDLFEIEVFGAIIDDVEAFDDLALRKKVLSGQGDLLFSGKQVIHIPVNVKNINWELSNDDRSRGEIAGTKIFEQFRVNNGRKGNYDVLFQPYPYDDWQKVGNIYELDRPLSLIDKGETGDEYLTIVVDSGLDPKEDVICFRMFVSSGEVGGHVAWFEIGLDLLSDYGDDA